MAKTNKAAFPQTPNTNTVATTAANTTLTDNPNNISAALVTFGAEGGELTKLITVPRATNTAAVAYLYSSIDSGTTKRLINTKAIQANTVSTTSAASPVDWGYSDTNVYRGKAGELLYIGTSVALTDGFVTSANWRDF